jgi:hypothetical protein
MRRNESVIRNVSHWERRPCVLRARPHQVPERTQPPDLTLKYERSPCLLDVEYNQPVCFLDDAAELERFKSRAVRKIMKWAHASTHETQVRAFVDVTLQPNAEYALGEPTAWHAVVQKGIGEFARRKRAYRVRSVSKVSVLQRLFL